MWTIALILNVIHLAYHQVTTNFDLFPFNNIRHYKVSERILEAGLNGMLMGFPIIALCLHNGGMVKVSAWALGFLVFGEFMSWWPHYFWDTRTKWGKWGRKWHEVYERTHKHTIKCLPPIKDHPIPNLEHCILQTLTLVTFVVTLWVCFKV